MENKQTTQRKRFLGGVMVISLSTLICKTIGLIFKIPMLKYVGLDGMVYFSAAYHIYLLLNSLSTAGMPVALSVLISRNSTKGKRANVRRIFLVSLTVFILGGLLGTGILFFGARFFSGMLRSMEEAAPAIRAISPTLFLVCIASALRGYFQGHEIMVPSAVSQLLESSGKLAFGILFASLAVSAGWETHYVAAAAIAGIAVGVLLGVIYLSVRLALFRRSKTVRLLPAVSEEKESVGCILSQLIVIALPITLASSVTSLTGLTDTVLIANRLIAVGTAPKVARTIYSSYSNLAVPLFNLPPALVTPLAISLVPALTSAIVSNDRSREKAVFNASFRLCIFAALPAAAGLSVFAEPILRFIFPGEADAIPIAAPLLSVLSISIIFTCLTTVTNAILQAYGKQWLPIISMSAGAAVKILVEYVLVGSPLGMLGAPISTFACTLTVVAFNLYFIGRYSPLRPPIHIVWRSLAATVVSISLSIGVFALLRLAGCGNRVNVLSAILSAMLFYLICALRFGAVTAADIELIPLGKKIAPMLIRLRLLK